MLCCCWEKNVEKKAITKPLLAERFTGEPKVIERKLTGFEPPLSPSPLPSPKPEPVPAPAPKPVVPKPEPVVPKPEPVVVIEPEPEVVIEPEPEVVIEPEPEPVKSLPPKPTIPKPVIQTAEPQQQEQEPATLLEKNDFIPREKKNRSKSRR
jgi:hypothetical protein